jgi:2-amino-4-hydroxy-6-hydroxymethyldihydropteridine diphosphokinase
MPVANVLIGLGANLGHRQATLESALEQLRRSADITVERVSPWLETEPAGGPLPQEPFLNGVAWIKTPLGLTDLLARLQMIEQAHGRERREVWGPRTLDLDILLHDDLVLNTPTLQIPHPWLPFRHFVLDPAVVIAPDWVHPILQKSIYELRVQLRAIPYWFVIDGGSKELRQTLANRLAQQFQGYAISAVDPGENLEGELPIRELPARGVFISSVDWTKQTADLESGLQIVISSTDTTPRTWRLDPGARSWPIPKARIRLCGTEAEFLDISANSALAPLYQALSPVPSLNLLADPNDRLLDQATTMIAAMTANS